MDLGASVPLGSLRLRIGLGLRVTTTLSDGPGECILDDEASPFAGLRGISGPCDVFGDDVEATPLSFTSVFFD